MSEPHSSSFLDLTQQMPSDQEAGYHKENIYASVSAGYPARPQMEEDYEEHRYGT